MKVLFICRANVGRSQMAEAFFNNLSKFSTATSAGAKVGEKEGRPLHEFVLESMKEAGIDLSDKRTKQVTRSMFDDADKVIVMTDKSHLPDFVNGEKVKFWKIIDMSATSLEFHREMRDKIKAKVERFVRESEY